MRLCRQVDPSDPRYKSMMCHHFTRGCCGHGDACSFAHSKVELRAGQVRVYGLGCRARLRFEHATARAAASG